MIILAFLVACTHTGDVQIDELGADSNYDAACVIDCLHPARDCPDNCDETKVEDKKHLAC